jgi:hypothetical protein
LKVYVSKSIKEPDEHNYDWRFFDKDKFFIREGAL